MAFYGFWNLLDSHVFYSVSSTESLLIRLYYGITTVASKLLTLKHQTDLQSDMWPEILDESCDY